MSINSTLMYRVSKKVNSVLIYLKFYYKRWKYKPVLILNYHQISYRFNEETDIESNWTSTETFKNAIRNLKKYRYNFIHLEDAINMLENNIPRKKHYVVITFDDGYASVLNILPYLKENRIPATFFINTAYLDEKKRNWIDISDYVQKTNISKINDEFKKAVDKLHSAGNNEEFIKYKEIVENYGARIDNWTKRYLSTDELFGITDPLFSFGLHGHEHYRFDIVSDEIFKSNIDKNIEILKSHPNYKPFFAFPFGKMRESNLNYLKLLNLKVFYAGSGLNYSSGSGYYRITVANENVNMQYLALKSREDTILNKIFRKYKNNQSESI